MSTAALTHNYHSTIGCYNGYTFCKHQGKNSCKIVLHEGHLLFTKGSRELRAMVPFQEFKVRT